MQTGTLAHCFLAPESQPGVPVMELVSDGDNVLIVPDPNQPGPVVQVNLDHFRKAMVYLGICTAETQAQAESEIVEADIMDRQVRARGDNWWDWLEERQIHIVHRDRARLPFPKPEPEAEPLPF